MIGFSTGEKDSIFFKVIPGLDDSGFRLTKTGTFSNKRVYEHLTSLRDLDNNVENDFHLVPSTTMETVFEVSEITSGDVEDTEEETKETVEKTDTVDSSEDLIQKDEAVEAVETVEKDVEEEVSQETDSQTSEEETW